MKLVNNFDGHARLASSLLLALLAGVSALSITVHCQSPQSSLTPLQAKIEKQRQRLASSEVEERRDALTRLAALHHPDASRVALSALTDPSPIVRATAAHASLSLPFDQCAAALLPLLNDPDEFVRRETAYALGKTRSRTAVGPLVEILLSDKEDSVRAAAAVALGEIGDEAAVVPLAQLLDPQLMTAESRKARKIRKRDNVLVLRAAAHSLGQIRSRAGVPALVAVLSNEKTVGDVKREAAVALGLIADPSATPALRNALTANDPYLASAAHEALRKIGTSRP